MAGQDSSRSRGVFLQVAIAASFIAGHQILDSGRTAISPLKDGGLQQDSSDDDMDSLTILPFSSRGTLQHVENVKERISGLSIVHSPINMHRHIVIDREIAPLTAWHELKELDHASDHTSLLLPTSNATITGSEAYVHSPAGSISNDSAIEWTARTRLPIASAEGHSAVVVCSGQLCYTYRAALSRRPLNKIPSKASPGTFN